MLTPTKFYLFEAGIDLAYFARVLSSVPYFSNF